MDSELIVVENQRGPSLNLSFEFRSFKDDSVVLSAVKNITDLAQFQLKFNNHVQYSQYGQYAHERTKKFTHQFFIRSVKHKSADCTNVRINVTCKDLNYSKQKVCSEEWSEWQLMGSVTPSMVFGYTMAYCSRIKFGINVYELKTPGFAKLYEDNELTDFHLRTKDGSVAVHKICLAAYSNVFKRMFSAQWKETKEDCIKLKDVTIKTLQDLKDYIYLGILHEDCELRPLLLLAARYFIEDLKAECVRRLALAVPPEDLHSLHALACENNIPELSIAISQLTPNDVVHRAYEIQNAEDSEPEKAE